MTPDPLDLDARAAAPAAVRRCLERGLRADAGGDLSVRPPSAEAIVIEPSGMGVAGRVREGFEAAGPDGTLPPSAHGPSEDLGLHSAIHRAGPAA